MCGGWEGGRVMENVARSANVLDTPLRFQLNHNDTVTTIVATIEGKEVSVRISIRWSKFCFTNENDDELSFVSSIKPFPSLFSRKGRGWGLSA